MFSWDVLVVAVIFTLVAVLFMGPGMWSSSNEFLFFTIWRSLRERWTRAPNRRNSLENPDHDPPADD